MYWVSRLEMMFVCFVLVVCGLSSLASPLSRELDVLLGFKQAITHDPLHSLASWNATNLTTISDACHAWTGLVCTHNATEIVGISLPRRLLQGSITPLLSSLPLLSFLDLSANNVSGTLPPELGLSASLSYLNLSNNHIVGTLPPTFSNLSTLRVLALENNSLNGFIPPFVLPHLISLTLSNNSFSNSVPTEIGQCASLQMLDLSWNSLSGPLPISVGNLTSLTTLMLRNNHLQGVIPQQLANCSLLQTLDLAVNNLSNTIPASLGVGCTQLRHFDLETNNLSGALPPEIGRLSKLEFVRLGGNRLYGEIMTILLNCTDLSTLDFWGNSFTGRIPPEIGTFRKFYKLGMYSNLLSGSIPASLGNCSSLSILVMGANQFSGTIPKELFRLNKLVYLDLQHNNLSGSVPVEIGNVTLVQRLIINNNQLTGNLPPELGDISALDGFTVVDNLFSGNIPSQLANCSGLIHLVFEENQFQGAVPSSFGSLAKLEWLLAAHNMLSGAIPSSLSNCTHFQNLSLSYNLLSGEIPRSVAALPMFLALQLAHNHLSGPVPPELGGMIQLLELDLSANDFSGPVPSSLSQCVQLTTLDLSSNNLHGSIALSLVSSLTSLVNLNLSHNSISGNIPPKWALQQLQQLDLSSNSLSGAIPTSLADMARLQFANFSFNNLEGPIPDQGIFQKLTSASFLGNPGLCGQALLHRRCGSNHSGGSLPMEAIIGLILAACIIFLVLVIAGCLLLVYRYRLQWSYNVRSAYLSKLSSTFLKLSEKSILEATNNFSDGNVLGSGGTGVVYKGTMADGKVLAFKRLMLAEGPAMNSFKAELRSVGMIRHRNLVTVLGYCSNLETNILILEYMPNGSLNEHLHGAYGNAKLSWEVRLRAAKGIAQGLVYLHYDCPTPVIHCDIKPSNILFDADMEARITDFGLSKLTGNTTLSTQNFGGSLGYLAPEYASSGQISRKCDVYSYGVVLMEMVSGRRPMDKKFGEEQTLVGWVRGMFESGDAVSVMDKNLQCEEEEEEEDTCTIPTEQIKCLIKLALLCTRDNPRDRPSMQQVVELLDNEHIGHQEQHHPRLTLDELIAPTQVHGRWAHEEISSL